MKTILIIVVVLVILYITSVPDKEKPAKEYTAGFGKVGDYLSYFNFGFAVGAKNFTVKASQEHMLVLGPSGSGKSTICFFSSIRSICKGGNNLIISDVSGELWDKTSSYLDKRGYNLYRINFANPAASHQFNPLLGKSSISEIQQLAQVIIDNTMSESKGDIFWKTASYQFLSVFLRYIIKYQPPEYCTMQNVLRLIEKFSYDKSQAVDKLFLKTDEELLSLYKSLLVLPQNTLQGIIQSTKIALLLWSDDAVCLTTSANNIPIKELRTQKMAIFVSNPLRDLNYFRPLSALFFQSIFDFVLQKVPKKSDKKVFIILDEFASMTFPNFCVTICNSRKYGCGMLLGVQDIRSLASRYSENDAHVIRTNCGIQVYMPNQPLQTCVELSKMMGRYSCSVGLGERQRELMSVDEIRQCNEQLIFVQNSPPLRYAGRPYYDSIWLSALANAKPLEVQPTSIKPPPLIQFA